MGNKADYILRQPQLLYGINRLLNLRLLTIESMAGLLVSNCVTTLVQAVFRRIQGFLHSNALWTFSSSMGEEVTAKPRRKVSTLHVLREPKRKGRGAAKIIHK